MPRRSCRDREACEEPGVDERMDVGMAVLETCDCDLLEGKEEGRAGLLVFAFCCCDRSACTWLFGFFLSNKADISVCVFSVHSAT